MRNKLLLILVALPFVIRAQNVPLNSGIGLNVGSDNFSYAGYNVGNYSIGWYSDSWHASAPTGYISGYGGLKFFTGGSPKMVIMRNGGFVGIGTNAPQAKLSVQNSQENGDLMVLGLGDVNPKRISLGVNQWSGVLSLYNSSNNQKVKISSGGEHSYFNAGYVGIGTTSPDELLTVNGTIHSKEVKVDTNIPAPDYVFAPEYGLPTLSFIEQYIKENQHLPEVPSAKEMEAEGINVGEMNMLLLKKVEELTLHIIELKKQNDQQNKLIQKLLQKE
ncbi:tail fiber protein [Fulvivirga ligni]|uniref:tail fiber protein n=1 Tax=Fulvivirga ligni TaxID=2904246 RepID=UPI001F460F49|nr:tail fiber protein [Fulvivirga ligni]UII22643.1 tail fiber protein [Fulvivirga ligni]